MTLFQSLFLAIVQGISEFLPISSSGHLNLFQHFFGLSPSLSFDIFLNTASLFSVLFFFRLQTKYFFTNLKYIVVGSIPAALVGILFKDQVEIIFGNIKLLPYFFLVTAVYLIFTKFLLPKNKKLSYQKALIIGLFQSIAILPAVSRSGSTIFAGLLLGLSAIDAFNFSFALFISASLGAILLSLSDLSYLSILSYPNIAAFITTFLIGLLALNLLKKSLVSRHFWLFGLYTLILGFTLFFFL